MGPLTSKAGSPCLLPSRPRRVLGIIRGGLLRILRRSILAVVRGGLEFGRPVLFSYIAGFLVAGAVIRRGGSRAILAVLRHNLWSVKSTRRGFSRRLN